MRAAWQWQVNQIFIELHPLALQQQKGSNEARVLLDLWGAHVPISFPKTFRHACIFCLVLEVSGTDEVVEELKRGWDYEAPYFRIPLISLGGLMYLHSGEEILVPKRWESWVVCVGIYIYVCTPWERASGFAILWKSSCYNQWNARKG